MLTRATVARDAWSESPQCIDASSFADALLPIRSIVPNALIDDRGWGRLRVRAESLPPSAADAMFGFECRLDDPEASADLLLSVLRDSAFADALALNGVSGGPKAASLARFLSEFRRPGTPYERTIDFVALEYDVVNVEGLPAPGVFLHSVADSGYADADILTEAIALVSGWKAKRTERNGAARIIDALPPGAAIRWAGAFPDRRERAVRLLVRGLTNSCSAFLSWIGWVGDATAIDRTVSAFRDCGIYNHVLALDLVEGQVSPGLGLELSRPGQTGGGWSEALNMMLSENLCLPGKAAALGLATRSDRVFSRAGILEIHCGLHHVKFGFSAHGCSDFARLRDCIVSAKAYISCALRPLP